MSRSEELQLKIDQLLWGKSIASVRDSADRPRNFILRSLTPRETNFINFEYRRELEEALGKGMLPEEELASIYERDGLWTPDDDIYVRGLERKIDILKNQLRQAQFLASRRKRAERDLKKSKEELEDKKKTKARLFALSADNRAEEYRRRLMIGLSTEDMKEQPFWPTEEDFMNESDFTLIYNLGLAYYQNNIFEQKETREIARSGLWRFRWSAAKKVGDLFGKPVAEWSEAQGALIYWSQFYDFVYESPDRPSEVMIDDDDAIDAWYEEQNKKYANKTDDKHNLVGAKKAKRNKFHQEHFIFVEPGDEEAIKKVQEMNPGNVRSQIRREHEKIKDTRGRVSEWQLRKDKYITGQM